MIDDKQKPLFESMNLKSSVWIEDVDSLINAETERIARYQENKRLLGLNVTDGFFDEYQTLDSINAFLDSLISSYPSLVTSINVGTSYEGRQIRGVKVTSTRNAGSKKGMALVAGVHCREWIGIATVNYMLNELVTKYGTDANVTSMMDTIEWTIIPVANPDGYVFTFTNGNRLWRKNRQPNPGSSCYGTDLNRNWPFKWNTGGSSNLPCSDTYHGPSAGSAPETKALSDYLAKNSAKLQGYLDYHAYSQLIMTPWGYSESLPADYSYLKTEGDKGAAALTAVYGTRYQVGSIANIIFVSSGSSVDYTYGQLGIKFSLAYELRDTGRYGFVLPSEQIIPSGIETFAALKVHAKSI